MNSKRIFDIVISLTVMLLSCPVIIGAAIGIKLSSPGPMFYRANRVGKDREVFKMHKLRTMHVHTSADNSIITGPNDSRIFKFGDFLRSTKIDELPQFIDVLRGKMSVVGPRPEDPQIVENFYTKQQLETLKVKPGVTSPAAVYYTDNADQHLGGEDVVDSYVKNLLAQKLKIESEYVTNASLSYDLKIIWDTMLLVMKSFLTYFSKREK